MSTTSEPKSTRSPPRIAYRGMMRRQPDGTFAGELRCTVSGWPLAITATIQEDVAGKYFALEATLGHAPDALRSSGADSAEVPA